MFVFGSNVRVFNTPITGWIMVHGGIIPIFDAKMAIFHVSLDAKLQFSVEICREF